MEPADAHDAGSVGPQSSTPNTEPADAHDAGPGKSPKRSQLMLMMPGLLGRKAHNGTS